MGGLWLGWLSERRLDGGLISDDLTTKYIYNHMYQTLSDIERM